MQSSFIFATLWFTAGPFLLTASAALMDLVYRILMWPAQPRRHKATAKARVPPRRPALRAEAVTSLPDGLAAAATRDEAERVNARVRRAHAGAWLIYAAVVSLLFIAFSNPKFGWPVRIAIGYFVLAPQLLILFWAIRMPMLRRLWILLVYSIAGAAFLLLMRPRDGAYLLWFVTFACALIPIPGQLFLFIRRNQPFLFLLIAIGAYSTATGLILDRIYYSNVDITRVIADQPWLVLLGLFNLVLGVAGAWLLLRQRLWWVRAVAIAAGVLAAILLRLDLRLHNLPTAVKFVCFVLLSVVPILVIWMIFKGLVRLGERRFLTVELVQVHLCWLSITLYYAWTTVGTHTFYTNRIAVRWGVFVALALFMVTLHLLLNRVAAAETQGPVKRLLLLRVFGKPNEREDLLEDLDDTWRRIGAVDLLAGSDLASRTLEQRMLETFLLRGREDQFLLDAAQLDERVKRRRSTFEADARYPVDAFFCHQSIWWDAFTRLAESTDVVLMDVRGFTTANEGCVRELEYLLKHRGTPLVMVSDAYSDLDAIHDKAQEANVEREPTIFDIRHRSHDERRALFDLLLKGAFAGP